MCFSKRIGSLGLADPEPPTGRQLQLQRSVRLQVTDYLKCNMMGLQVRGSLITFYCIVHYYET